MPVNDTYSAAGTIYAGRTAPAGGYPSWRPAPGFFADVGLNTLLQAEPTGWPNSDIGGCYANWSSHVPNPDLSPLGGITGHGSGHLTTGLPQWAGVTNWNATTRLYTMSNVPPSPFLEGDVVNGFGEAINAPNTGHTYTPHTYGGLILQTAAQGGSSKGSLFRLCFAGAGLTNPKSAHKFDLSSPTLPGARFIDDMGGTSYPMACDDLAGTGFYFLSNNGTGPMRHYDKATGAYTVITGNEFNEYGDYFMTLIPGARPALIATGRSGGGGVNMGIYVNPIVGGNLTGWTQITPTGTRPADARCGTRWSRLLNCLVCYEAAGSLTVHRLNLPPTGSLATGTWSWTSETVTGVGGAVVSRSRTNDNGAWGRFVELYECGCFAWCDSVFDKMQAFTLQGM